MWALYTYDIHIDKQTNTHKYKKAISWIFKRKKIEGAGEMTWSVICLLHMHGRPDTVFQHPPALNLSVGEGKTRISECQLQ